MPSNQPRSIQPSVALYFSGAPPVRRPVMTVMASKLIDIPAGDANYVVTDQYQLPVPADLIGLVMRQGMWLTMVASALGLIAAVALTRFMASMLFNVAPRDPITFAVVAALLGLVALAATLFPALRAMRVNPVTALRE